MAFRIIQITDCHLFADKHKVVGEGIVSFNTLATVLEAIAQYKADLVIVTGDLSADESKESYQHFNELWSKAKIKAKLRTIPGNHDNAHIMQASCSEFFWQHEVLEAFDWKLHCLHSQVLGEGIGRVDDSQLKTLKQAIDSYPSAHHFVAVHHHPVAMNSWMDNYEWTNRQSFVDLVKRHKTIKIVMHGHVHTERDIPLGQARLITTPSTCWQFKHEPEFAFEQGSPAFRLVDLYPAGHFETSVIFVE